MSAADIEDLKFLQECGKKIANLKNQIAQLESEEKKLDDAIQFADTLRGNPSTINTEEVLILLLFLFLFIFLLLDILMDETIIDFCFPFPFVRHPTIQRSD